MSNVLNAEKVLATEYDPNFDELRKNRLVVSYYKYGPVRVNYGKKLIDAIASMERCVSKYQETGNTEYLVDAANYLMFEFMYSTHEKSHFRATSDDESAGIVGMCANEINSFKDAHSEEFN